MGKLREIRMLAFFRIITTEQLVKKLKELKLNVKEYVNIKEMVRYTL